MLTSARLVLKHHRFEVGTGVAVGLLLAVAALWVTWQLTALNVPPGCFERWLTGGPDGAGDCTGPVQAFATINEEQAGKVFTGLGLLPLALGLVSGVTLVGRELEGRTAQTAWALTPSRRRWLAHQVAPVLLVILVVAALAGVAGTILVGVRLPWYHSAFSDFFLHGLPVIGRSVGAFGIGLVMGAVMGRVLPGLLVGIGIAIVVLTLSGNLHQGWMRANTQEIVDPEFAAGGSFDGLVFGEAFRDPGGRRISFEEAAVGAPPDEDTREWILEQHPDWVPVYLGLPASKAPELAALDAAAFTLVGLLGLAVAFPVVDRRRPS